MPDASRPSLPVKLLSRWGAMWLRTFALIGGVAWLLADVTHALWRAFILRRERFGRSAVISQFVRVGNAAIGIVLLVSGCIGLILALQMEPPLRDFGQTDKIANIVGIAVFRELGPLISAVVLAGFAGAAIAAEIGSMVVGEEVEALEAHALNPVRFLVVPRVLATTISLVLLTVLADLMSVICSGIVCIGFLDIPAQTYVDNTIAALGSSDFTTGLVKAGVFGMLLSAIACHNGLRVTGGAKGVGQATTNTVVQSIVAVITADLMFTLVFFLLGWN